MKRRILLPTDFSKNAWRAITYAQELYKNESCNFYILNVFFMFLISVSLLNDVSIFSVFFYYFIFILGSELSTL